MFQKVIGQKTEPVAPAAGQATQQKPINQQSSPQSPAPSSNRAPATTSPSTTSPTPSGRNVLSTDVTINGKIKFSNDLVVDGKIDGEVESDGSLTVGENAHLKAEIKTRSIIVYGKVHGNIDVMDKVELKANSELVGNIKAASLSIEPGAIFVGKSTVGTPSIKPAATAQKTTSSTPSKPNAAPVKAKA